MIKTYSIEDTHIKVAFGQQLIQITNDQELWKFLSADVEGRTRHLVGMIKNDYFKWQKDELKISEDSLIVEIWAHVYVEYFTLALKRLFEMKIMDRVAALVVKRSEIIDCGAGELDNNRKIWDLIAPFRGIIAKMLPNIIADSR